MIATRCPACRTVFRVRPEQLRARGGEVRCGQCLSAFNALDHLVEGEIPAAAPPPAAEAPTSPPRGASSSSLRPRRDTIFVLEEKTPAEPEEREAEELHGEPAPTAAAPEPEPPRVANRHPLREAGGVPGAGVTPRTSDARAEPVREEPSPTERPSDDRDPGQRGTGDGSRDETGTAEGAADEPGHRASTFESLADRLEFEIPETFLTQTAPPATPDSERMNHVRYRQRKMEWPEIPRPPAPPFPEFVAPAEAGSRPPPEGERSAHGRSRPAGIGPAVESAPADTTGGAAPRTAPAEDTAGWAGTGAAGPADTESPAAPPVSPEAVDAALREAATDGEAERGAPAEPRVGRSAPPMEPEPVDLLDSDRLDLRYGPLPRPPRSRALWGLGLGVLMGILAVQAAYLFRDEITRTWPQLRPAFVLACEYLGCTLELPRIAAAIEIETSDLLSDPQRPGSFTLNAVVRNNAPHPQAYPYLELTLTDARDRPVIRRALSPQEWVPADKLEGGFPAGDEISVRLPFEAADVEAVGYRIYAFYP